MTPFVEIKADGVTAGEELTSRLLRCEVVDSTGSDSDSAMLQIHMRPDEQGRVPDEPRQDVELEIVMGWVGGKQASLGKFVVDAVEVSGPPDTMTIRCNAANMHKSLSVKTSKSWGDITLQVLVNSIASANGLTPAVAADLAGFEYKGLNQEGETPLSLLNRLAKDMGAAAKVVAGFLIVAVPGDGRSISGRDLPIVAVDAADFKQDSPYRYVSAGRPKQKGVRAKWWSVPLAEEQVAEAGTAPFSELRNRTFANKAAAQAAVNAELDRTNRGASTLSFAVIGNPDLVAEVRAQISGHNIEKINALWALRKAQHIYDSKGYVTRAESEVPKA